MCCFVRLKPLCLLRLCACKRACKLLGCCNFTACADWACAEPLQEIAEIKLPDLNAITVEAAMRIVEGTAKNMGVTVSD